MLSNWYWYNIILLRFTFSNSLLNTDIIIVLIINTSSAIFIQWTEFLEIPASGSTSDEYIMLLILVRHIMEI